MPTDSLQWDDQVDLVVRKYASNKTKQERDDLYQDAHLALLEAGEAVTSPALAYEIAHNAVLDAISKSRKFTKNGRNTELTEPDAAAASTFASIDADQQILLDSTLTTIRRFPEPERFILQVSFGVDGHDQLTIPEIAHVLNKSPRWVSTKKQQALQKLRNALQASRQ